MAENKASFLLYADIIHVVDMLTDEQAGVLFKTVLAYVNDEDPEVTDPMIKLVFEPIRQRLKRDLKKWEAKREKQVEGGKRSAELRKQAKLLENNDIKDNKIVQVTSSNLPELQDKPTEVNLLQHASSSASVNVNANANVNVNANVIVDDKSSAPPEPLPITGTVVYNSMDEVRTVLMFYQSQWQDVVCKNNGIEQGKLNPWIEKFHDHAFTSGKDHVTLQAYKQHFNNWLGYQEFDTVIPSSVPAESTERPLTALERYNLQRFAQQGK